MVFLLLSDLFLSNVNMIKFFWDIVIILCDYCIFCRENKFALNSFPQLTAIGCRERMREDFFIDFVSIFVQSYC